MPNVPIFLTLFAHEFIQNRVFWLRAKLNRISTYFNFAPNEAYKSYYLSKLAKIIHFRLIQTLFQSDDVTPLIYFLLKQINLYSILFVVNY